MLNEKLAEEQKVTKQQRLNIEVLYQELSKLLVDSKTTPDVAKPKLSIQITDLEYELQKNWNFPLNPDFHKYQFHLNGCTCPSLDNSERFGFAKFFSESCSYHGPILFAKNNPIKIIDEKNVTLKSETTKSIDVHLQEDDQQLNVIFPSGSSLSITTKEISFYQPDDTLVKSIPSHA